MARKRKSKAQGDETSHSDLQDRLSRIEQKLDVAPRVEKKLDEFIAEYRRRQDPYLLVPEVARFLRADERTVHRWIHERKLKASKIAGSGKHGPFRIRRVDVDAFMVEFKLGKLSAKRFEQIVSRRPR